MSKLGFAKIDTAVNGLEAVDAVKKKHYDIIFMDCQMPLMDGFEATKAIRDMEKLQAGHENPLLIFAMTANAMVGDREKCLKVGMNEYISKPLNVKKLTDLLSQWFMLDEIKSNDSEAKNTKEDGQELLILDREHLNTFTDGDKTAEAELFDMFKETAEESLMLLMNSLASNDNEAWESQAHRLKGAAGNFGALRLHKFASEAEEKAQAHAQEKEAMLNAISNAYNELVKEINKN